MSDDNVSVPEQMVRLAEWCFAVFCEACTDADVLATEFAVSDDAVLLFGYKGGLDDECHSTWVVPWSRATLALVNDTVAMMKGQDMDVHALMVVMTSTD